MVFKRLQILESGGLLHEVSGHRQITKFYVCHRYMYGLLKKKMQEIGASIYMEISQDEVEWLALVAFHKILFKKQSRYLELLSFLQARLRKPNFGSMNSCPHLSSAIDDQRSSMFKCIVY